MTSRTLLDVLTCSVLVWNSLSSSSVRGRKLSSFSGYSCQPMAFSNLRKRRYFFCLVACMKVCVCVRRSAGSCVVPVLSLQRARQVFGVWVTEGVGQTVLMADFFTVRFGLRGVAFTLKTFALEGGCHKLHIVHKSWLLKSHILHYKLILLSLKVMSV